MRSQDSRRSTAGIKKIQNNHDTTGIYITPRTIALNENINKTSHVSHSIEAIMTSNAIEFLTFNANITSQSRQWRHSLRLIQCKCITSIFITLMANTTLITLNANMQWRSHGGGTGGRAPPQPRPGPPMRFVQIRRLFWWVSSGGGGG